MASAVQLRAGAHRERNLSEAQRLVEAAASEGARLVVLPELFSWRGPQAEEVEHAETLTGPTAKFASRLAERLSIYLVAGSILERTEDGRNCYNTCLFFGPDGALLAHYRKIHLFDVMLEGEVKASESRTRHPGQEVVCVTTSLATIGLAVCYDLRFPELFRRLAADGADLVVVPSAFTAPTGAAHWHVLIRARAIENQCYVIAANQFGPTQHGFDDYGHSLIVDPWGRVLAEASASDHAVITATLEPERLERVRMSLPSLTHRRLGS